MSLVDDLKFGYKFEESTGAATWADVLAAFDLTATGTITSATGVIGQAASGFSNATNYLTRTGEVISASPYSVSLWFFVSSTASTQYFWSQSLLGVAKEFLRVNGGRSASFQFQAATVSLGVTLNAWHHLVGIDDGTSVKLYVDGIYRASGTSLAFLASDAMHAGSLAGGTVQTGRLDSLYGWSRALTDGGISVGQTAGGEVAALYNSGAALDYPWTTDGDLDATLETATSAAFGTETILGASALATDAALLGSEGKETIAGVSASALSDVLLLAEGGVVGTTPSVVTRVSLGPGKKKRPPIDDAARRSKCDADIAAALLLMG